MKILLYQWLKKNSIILINSASLIGTTAVTSVLGFAYWWVAARQFSPEAVGFASASISAMILLGNICMLGLGTLLIGELPRQPGNEISLINAALILVGVVGGCVGIVFAIAASAISADFQVLGANIQNIAFFAVGVSLTSIALVLDQALIGLLRGELQLWRNALFAAGKLVALLVVGLWLSYKVGLTIYMVWTIANVLSLVVLGGFVIFRGKWRSRNYLPNWRLLGKMKSSALQHHIINLILQAPPLILPVLVIIMLSARVNAWFYISSAIAAFVSFIPLALTTVLYAASSAKPATLPHKARLTLSLAFLACTMGNLVLLLFARQLLSLFGQAYADQASWSLRILGLGAFPLIIKTHYITVHRIRGQLAQAMFLTAVGGGLEVVAPVLGAWFYSLLGLSLGLILALCVEAVFMFRTVYKAVYLADTST